jgi:hypothetical protein
MSRFVALLFAALALRDPHPVSSTNMCRLTPYRLTSLYPRDSDALLHNLPAT